MVQFTQCGFRILFYSDIGYWNLFQWVTPFGNPGITGYVLLPLAFRSLSRPSSPRSSKASTIHLYSLDHIIVSSYFQFLRLVHCFFLSIKRLLLTITELAITPHQIRGISYLIVYVSFPYVCQRTPRHSRATHFEVA